MTRKKWSWFTIVNYAVLSLLIVICLVPILHMRMWIQDIAIQTMTLFTWNSN